MTLSTAVQSNAFNFMSFIENGVDPRTGLYTLSINLPPLKSHDLNGPEFALSLNYNPLNTINSGYGLGWDLRLSQFDPSTGILSLSTGETFKSNKTEEGRLKFAEQKLDTFRCFDDGDGWYRVVHKSGTVEFLQKQEGSGPTIALPRYIESASGHRLTLAYLPFNGTHRLESISDGASALLEISIDNRTVRIDQRPGAGEQMAPWAQYVLHWGADESVERITLPSDPLSSWRFTYARQRGLLCLETIGSPTGSVETLEYQDDGHVFPSGIASAQGTPTEARLALKRAMRDETAAQRALRERAAAREALPRVTLHRTEPGFGQPAMVIKYSYELHGEASIHNFLGGGLADVVYEDDGFDNLYKTTTHYEYGSVESLLVGDQPVRRIARTFNRYHLLTQETTTQGTCVHEVTTTYHIEDGLPFDLQLAIVQLPREVKTVWRELVSGSYQDEVQRTTFDEYGNPARTESANGVVEESSWYPAGGAEGCPKDAYDFVRHLRERKTIPAPSAHYQAPTLTTRYRYALQAPVGTATYGDGPAPKVTRSNEPWLVPVSELLLSLEGDTPTELHVTVTDYVHAPDDLMTHGRVGSVRTTLAGQTQFPQDGPPLTLGGYTSITAYTYQKLPETQRLRTTQTLTTFDSLIKDTIREDSLITGTTLLDVDDTDIKIETLYNALDQVISETAAPGTDEQATRRYEYRLVNEPGEQASQTVIDVKSVQTRTWFDGLNRVIGEERQRADSPARANEFIPTYAAQYDAMGQLVSETSFDMRLGDAPAPPGLSFGPGEWDWSSDDALALNTTYTYDDWGQQCAVTGPDGVVDHQEVDPTSRVTTAWRTGLGKTLTRTNLFDEPEWVERQDLQGERYSREESEYDGLGRLCRRVDARNRSTTYAYDVYDRLISNVLPDGAEVKREYAVHSSEDLPIAISVHTRAKTYVLGSQVFDGLSRLTWSITGERATHNLYVGSQLQPAVVKTPGGARILYSYKPHLSDEPTERFIEGQGVKASYTHDPLNARLSTAIESGHTFNRTYFSTGELRTETRSDDLGDSEMGYVYSLQGRLLCYNDVLGNTQTHAYDLGGRLTTTRLGTTQTTLTYNASGLSDAINTFDTALGQQVFVALAYDDQGRECLRTFDLGDDGVQTLAQAYNVLDQMTRRSLAEGAQTGGEILRDEQFGYDVRGRLNSYSVQGSEAPFDPAGHQIVEQVFYCDAIDNHDEVLTVFQSEQGEQENTAFYEYSAHDPAQLVKISNDHPVYAAAFDMELTYDANGCLLIDEAGRRLEYDALSRLVAVQPPEGERLAYGYDALDILSAAGTEQRFYCAGELVSLVDRTAPARTIMRAGEALVAEHQAPSVKPA